MIDHIDFAVTDLKRSREFYSRTLKPLGITPVMDINRRNGHEGTGFGRDFLPQFWIGGGSAVVGRLHVAFEAKSPEAVDAFHGAALEAGGSCKGKPGLRPRYGDSYYAAFVLDPDGHTIEAVCRRREPDQLR